MNNPQPNTNFPWPTNVLRFAGDPTEWGVKLFDAVLTSGGPVALVVSAPVAGKLVLAPSQVGSLPPPAIGPLPGWVPCVMLPSPYLYLPSPVGVDAGSPGDMLAGPDTNVEALQDSIMTAMRDGTELNVSVTIDGRASNVVVNGAEVPFVVLAIARPDLQTIDDQSYVHAWVRLG